MSAFRSIFLSCASFKTPMLFIDLLTDATWNNTKMDFSVTNIIYDENSNLKQMYQKGVIPGNNEGTSMSKRRVVVTGMGIISPVGNDIASASS